MGVVSSEDGDVKVDQSLFVPEGELYTLPPESVRSIIGLKVVSPPVRHSKPGWKVVTLRSDMEVKGLFLLSPNLSAEARFPVQFERKGTNWEYSFDARQRIDAAIVLSGSTYFFDATTPTPEKAGIPPEPLLLSTPSVSIPPDFFSVVAGPMKMPVTIEAGLMMKGVEFPPGAAVLKGAATGQFLMRNTKDNHERLSRFIANHWKEAEENE